jgi:hypothetical protein
VLTLSTPGEGANSLLLRLHLSTHQSLLHCTLSPAIHFNGSNGTAYTRASKVRNRSTVLLYWALVIHLNNSFKHYLTGLSRTESEINNL